MIRCNKIPCRNHDIAQKGDEGKATHREHYQPVKSFTMGPLSQFEYL